MFVMYVLLAMWSAIFLFVSYHAVVHGYKWAELSTRICFWMMFILLLGAKMFG